MRLTCKTVGCGGVFVLMMINGHIHILSVCLDIRFWKHEAQPTAVPLLLQAGLRWILNRRAHPRPEPPILENCC